MKGHEQSQASQETQVWEPPELVGMLVPGTQVRIRLNGECTRWCPNGCELTHRQVTHGEEGVVTRRVTGDSFAYVRCTLCDGNWPESEWPLAGHFYGVEIPGHGGPSLFAALELEPIGRGREQDPRHISSSYSESDITVLGL